MKSAVGTIVRGETIMNSNVQVSAQPSYANSGDQVSACKDDVLEKQHRLFVECSASAHGGHGNEPEI